MFDFPTGASAAAFQTCGPHTSHRDHTINGRPGPLSHLTVNRPPPSAPGADSCYMTAAFTAPLLILLLAAVVVLYLLATA